jgi:hypothetical protein
MPTAAEFHRRIEPHIQPRPPKLVRHGGQVSRLLSLIRRSMAILES